MENIQNRLADGFDPSDTSLASGYAYAEGSVLGIAWSLVRRVSKQFQARSTIDWLADFEKILGLRPTSRLSTPRRRKIIASRLKGLDATNLSKIQEMSEEVLGNHLISLQITAPGDTIRYWPPNPGPPGYEWMSNRLVVYAKVQKIGSSEDEFATLIRQWEENMHRIMPVYCDFDWHTGDNFYLGESFLGEDAYG